MTASELMKPRYEVIADYPFNPHKIATILSSDNKSLHQTTTSHRDEFGEIVNSANYCFALDFDKYPHLFRKLNWWEFREVVDMPKRLICKAIKNDNEIMEIIGWDMDIFFGWIDKKERKGCCLKSFNPQYGYFPVD